MREDERLVRWTALFERGFLWCFECLGRGFVRTPGYGWRFADHAFHNHTCPRCHGCRVDPSSIPDVAA